MLRERGFSWRALLDTVVTTVWIGDFRVARVLGKWKVVIHRELQHRPKVIQIIKLFILLYPLTLFLVSKCHPMRFFISY
jgi:hypothetical protein